jgi:putative SOS response-associated peptidase YedK
MAPIHDRMTVFLRSRDYAQCLGPSERPPLHLLRILSPEGMSIRQIEKSMINIPQANLFDPR